MIGGQGEQAGTGVVAVDAIDARVEIPIVISVDVGTNGGKHAPGGQAEAVKAQGNDKAAHIHVVHIVGVGAGGSFTREVIIVGSGPEGCQGDVGIEGVAGRDGRHVGLEDGRAVHGHVGQTQALQAHAQLEGRVGHHPVDEGALYLDDVLVTAKGHAVLSVCCLAPDGLAYFEVDLAGEVFACHCVDLQANTGPGLEFVLARIIACALAGKIAMLTILEAGEPDALGLELYGLGRLRTGKTDACGKEEAGKFSEEFGTHAFFLPGCVGNLPHKRLFPGPARFFGHVLPDPLPTRIFLHCRQGSSGGRDVWRQGISLNALV